MRHTTPRRVSLIWQGSGRHVIRATLALSFGERLRGLLGTESGSPTRNSLFLAPCSSIHTFGMGYALDVACVGKDGAVVWSVRGMTVGRALFRACSWAVLEREASEGWWPGRGDRLLAVVLESDEG